jgi:hypothetical protein
MTEDLAAKVMAAALALDRAFGELDVAVSQIPDPAEREKFARNLGDLIGKVNDDFIRPIARAYPNLDPTSD